MWVAGNIAAEICLEDGGIDSIDLVYHAGGTPSVASSQSFVRMNCHPQFYLSYGELVQWPAATAFDVSVPGIHQIQKTLPWGGGGEPVWYEGDSRVSNCQVLTALKREVIDYVVGLMKEFEEKYKHATREEQDRATNEWGSALIDQEPPRQHPDIDRVLISCLARGRTRSRHVSLPNACSYTQTAVIAVAAIQRLLSGRVSVAGFAPPAAAFGARYLINAMSDEGLHCHIDDLAAS